MKKRIGAMLVAGLMVCTVTASVALAGCGDGGPTGGPNGGNNSATVAFQMPEGGFDTTKPVTIRFDHTMGAKLRDVLDIYIAEFNKLYPNITVEHEQVGGYDDVRDNITKQLMAGEEPNIAYCYPDHVALYNRAKAVLTLNDFLPGGAYAGETYTTTKKDAEGNDVEVEIPLTITRADGTTELLGLTEEQKGMFIEGYYNEGFEFDDGSLMYTMPFSKSTEVLYYNKTYFTANNLKVPTTWEEMAQVSQQILDLAPTTDPGIDVIPFGYDSEANWFITMTEQYGSEYTSSTGEKFRFDNAKNREFVSMFADWFEKGYFTTQKIYNAYTSGLFVSLTEQKSYMGIGSSAGATNQRPSKVDNGQYDGYPFEVGIAPIPQVDASNPKAISQGPSVCIFKKSNPQEMMASWLFVKFLTTSVEFQSDFSQESGYIPVLNLETMMSDPLYAAHLDEADGGDGIAALAVKVALEQENAYYTSPAFVGSSEARDQVGNLMQAVFTGAKSLDQAFKDAIGQCRYKFD